MAFGGLKAVADLDLEVRSGELVGLIGPNGAGKTTVFNVITGVYTPTAGRILLEGRPLPIGSARDAIRHGVCLVPEDRRRCGVVAEMNIRENVTLPALASYARAGLVARPLEAEAVRRITTALAVKTASIETPVAALSGGNQQRVALGKWLALRPRVIEIDRSFGPMKTPSKPGVVRIASIFLATSSVRCNDAAVGSCTLR